VTTIIIIVKQETRLKQLGGTFECCANCQRIWRFILFKFHPLQRTWGLIQTFSRSSTGLILVSSCLGSVYINVKLCAGNRSVTDEMYDTGMYPIRRGIYRMDNENVFPISYLCTACITSCCVPWSIGCLACYCMLLLHVHVVFVTFVIATVCGFVLAWHVKSLLNESIFNEQISGSLSVDLPK